MENIVFRYLNINYSDKHKSMWIDIHHLFKISSGLSSGLTKGLCLFEYIISTKKLKKPAHYFI